MHRPVFILSTHLAALAMHDFAVLDSQPSGYFIDSYGLLAAHALPVVGWVLLRRRALRPGLAWLTVGLACSLLYLARAQLSAAAHPPRQAMDCPAGLFELSLWLLGVTDLLALALALRSARRTLLPQGARVLLVDGTCVFCNRLVSQILQRDKYAVYYFAHLQSDYGRAALARHGANPDDLDGVYLLIGVDKPSEELLKDGAAGRAIWPSLLGVASPLLLVPSAWLDPLYKGFARIRYRLFGRYERCHVPSNETRARFLTSPSSL